MVFGESAGRKSELAFEDLQDCVCDFERFEGERPYRRFHAGFDGGRIRAVRDGGEGQNIILCDVYELDGIGVSGVVSRVCPSSLIA